MKPYVKQPAPPGVDPGWWERNEEFNALLVENTILRQSAVGDMNCTICHKPVPACPKDDNGVPLLPEVVHFECLADWLDTDYGFNAIPNIDPNAGTTIQINRLGETNGKQK